MYLQGQEHREVRFIPKTGVIHDRQFMGSGKSLFFENE